MSSRLNRSSAIRHYNPGGQNYYIQYQAAPVPPVRMVPPLPVHPTSLSNDARTKSQRPIRPAPTTTSGGGYGSSSTQASNSGKDPSSQRNYKFVPYLSPTPRKLGD